MPLCDVCHNECESYIDSNVVAFVHSGKPGQSTDDETKNANFKEFYCCICHSCVKKRISHKKKAVLIRKLLLVVPVCIIFSILFAMLYKLDPQNGIAGFIIVYPIIAGIIFYNIYRYIKSRKHLNDIGSILNQRDIIHLDGSDDFSVFDSMGILVPQISEKLDMNGLKLQRYMTREQYINKYNNLGKNMMG